MPPLRISNSGLVLAFALSIGPALAANHSQFLGPVAPPSVVGGNYVIPAPADSTPEFDLVNSAPLSANRSVGFAGPLEHLVVPYSWGSWGHGYEGDVYAIPTTTTGLPDFSVTLTLPSKTSAFVFYAEPSELGPQNFTVSGDGITPFDVLISGDDAAGGFAFYADPGSWLGSLKISSPGKFAIGEFLSTAVPESQTGIAGIALATLGAMAWLRRQRGA